MSVVVNVTFKAKEDQYQALYDTLVAILPDTAKFQGAELVSCAADPEDKSFHIHEVWDTIDSQKAYLGWRGEMGHVEQLVAMLREPPEFKQEEHLVFG